MPGVALGEVQICTLALRQLGDNAISQLAEATRRAEFINDFYVPCRDATLIAHPWNFSVLRTILYAYVVPGVGAVLSTGFTSGTGIIFTVSVPVFNAVTDVGKVLRPLAGGSATITSVTDASHVVTDITATFPGTVIAADQWRLYSPIPAYGSAYAIPVPADCLRAWRTKWHQPYQVESGFIVSDVDALPLRYIKQVTDTTMYSPLFRMALVDHLSAMAAEPITGQASKYDRFWSKYQARLKQARTIDGMEGTPERLRSRELIDPRYDGGGAGGSTWWGSNADC